MKRKSEGDESPRKRGGNRTKKTKQESSDEEDDCAAVNCLRPSGKDDFIIYIFGSVVLNDIFKHYKYIPNIIIYSKHNYILSYI